MTPLSEEQALDELRKYSGIHSIPEIVEAFDRLIAQTTRLGHAEHPEAPHGAPDPAPWRKRSADAGLAASPRPKFAHSG